MEKETIEKILNFLETNEDKQIPSKWFVIKFIDKLENHPDDVQYRHKGSLELGYEKIKKLPNDLYVRGYITLAHCRQLTKLPDKLYVGEGLDLGGCDKITKLPDNLYVGDYLGMIGINIQEIPNNLYIGGDLYINNTPLANKHTNKEIYEIVASTGGEIKGKIHRW